MDCCSSSKAANLARGRAALLLALFLTGGLHASPPGVLGFQGRLVDELGRPLTGALTVTFEIAPVGAPGSPVWTEDRTLALDSLGVFSLGLGEVTTLTPADFSGLMALNMKEQGTGSPLMPAPLTLDSQALVYRAAVAESLAPRTNLSLGSFRITSLADPTKPQDAATRNWADQQAAANPTGPQGPTGPMGETSPSTQLHQQNSTDLSDLTTRVSDLEAAVAILTNH